MLEAVLPIRYQSRLTPEPRTTDYGPRRTIQNGRRGAWFEWLIVPECHDIEVYKKLDGDRSFGLATIGVIALEYRSQPPQSTGSFRFVDAG